MPLEVALAENMIDSQTNARFAAGKKLFFGVLKEGKQAEQVTNITTVGELLNEMIDSEELDRYFINHARPDSPDAVDFTTSYRHFRIPLLLAFPAEPARTEFAGWFANKSDCLALSYICHSETLKVLGVFDEQKVPEENADEESTADASDEKDKEKEQNQEKEEEPPEEEEEENTAPVSYSVIRTDIDVHKHQSKLKDAIIHILLHALKTYMEKQSQETGEPIDEEKHKQYASKITSLDTMKTFASKLIFQKCTRANDAENFALNGFVNKKEWEKRNRI